MEKNMRKNNEDRSTVQQDERVITSNSSNSSQDSLVHEPIGPLHHLFQSPSQLPRQTGQEQHQKLTLSAFRKPEQAVRLTNASPHKILLNDYDFNSVSKVLGHGASSTVRLAKHRVTGDKVAVKCVGKHQILRSYLHSGKRPMKLDECKILSSLQGYHENIINLIDVYETDNHVQLVLEYCAGGELFDAIKRRRPVRRCSDTAATSVLTALQSHEFLLNQHVASPKGYTELQSVEIAAQLLSALAFLHKRGIVHRDVKPENILLVSDDDDDLTIKLSDFGLARMLEGEVNDKTPASPLTPPSAGRSRAYSRVGSDYYAAPEMAHDSGYDTAVDMYSLGVTLYIILSGIPPPSKQYCGSTVLDEDDDDSSTSSSSDESEDPVKSRNQKTNKRKRLSSYSSVDFPIKQWRHVSTKAKDLIRQMLHPDPLFRITAEDALQHEWILLSKHQSQFKSSEKITPILDNRIVSPTSQSSVQSQSNIQWGFMNSNLMEKTPTVLLQGVVKGSLRNHPKKKRKTSLDIRIPPPQNISLSMVELYNRINSNTDSSLVPVDSCDDENEAMVEVHIGENEDRDDDEQSSCFQNRSAFVLSV